MCSCNFSEILDNAINNAEKDGFCINTYGGVYAEDCLQMQIDVFNKWGASLSSQFVETLWEDHSQEQYASFLSYCKNDIIDVIYNFVDKHFKEIEMEEWKEEECSRFFIIDETAQIIK